MINERQAELLAKRLIRRTEQANIYFLEKIGNSVKQIRELTPSQAQQLVQMLKYGEDYNKIVEELSRYTNLNVQEIDEIFKEYAKKDQLFYKKFYRYRNIPFVPFDENQILKRQTQALANIAKTELFNFTRNNVIGYTIYDVLPNGKRGKARFYGLRETYNRVLDEALLNVGQGKETFDSAMKRILEDIGGSGLKTLNYQSGRAVRLDSAISMHLNSRLRELHNENQKLFGQEFGANMVEISVHLHPALDHLMQGHQFMIEEFDKLQNGELAKDLNGETYSLDHDNDGNYRPISEMNCYHYVFYGIAGVNKPEYNEKQLQKIIDENNEGFTFENKHYTLYAGEQLLRKAELELRKSKDIQILARSSNNVELISKMQSKITEITNKYHKILKASGLKSELDRARVSGYCRVNVTKMK